MGENKNSGFEIKNNSVENNSNPQVELASFRPGSSSSNPRPGLSNSNRPVHFNHWLERVRDHVKELEIMLNELEITPKKRSHSDNDDWGKDNKLNKRETLDKVKEGNSENDGNERSNENSHNIPIMSLQDIVLSSQQMVLSTMSQLQAIPYPSYGWNASENNLMDHNKEADAANRVASILPMNSRRPASNIMPLAVNNVASTLGIGISYGQESVPPASVMNVFPDVNMGNRNGSLYRMIPMMPNISSYTPFPVMNNIDPIVPKFNILEPIIIPHAVLTPPVFGEGRHRRLKPPGCRTVFVGNLPEKITEEIIKEAFKICGLITVVRMSKRNFCHIRFVNMESVDQALLLSGFRIRIDESEDPAYNSRLCVDYAVARDDQHDYECLERTRLHEERQKQAFHPPSPPPIPHISEHEAQTLAERLRNEETFREGLQVLITWLDRGECNKRNSGTFYSLIQISHSHVKRLRNEKSRYEEEAEKAKENLTNKNRLIGQEINEIEKVFVAAKTQKVWDNLTRSQRKKIEEMKNDTYDLKQTNSEDLLETRVEDEMELSDNEENCVTSQLAPADELSMLHERINSLSILLDNAHQTIEEFKGDCAEHKKEIVKLRLELEDREKKLDWEIIEM